MTISSLDPSGELGRLFSSIQTKTVSSADSQKTHGITANRPQDDVALSTFAQEVRDISRQAREYPSIREDRVQTVQSALSSHQLLANSQDIADALLRETFVDTLAVS